MNERDSIERNNFWTGIMEQYEKSGFIRKVFCFENNLSLSQFRNWRCRINRARKSDKKIPFDNKFIPLVVADSPIPRQAVFPNTIDLKLDPSGNISLSIPPQFNLEYLSSLLTVLRRIGC